MRHSLILTFILYTLFGCTNNKVDRIPISHQLESSAIADLALGFWQSEESKLSINPEFAFREILQLNSDQFSLFSREMGPFARRYIIRDDSLYFFYLSNQDTILMDHPFKIMLPTNDSLVLTNINSRKTFTRISEEAALKYVRTKLNSN